MVGVCKPNHVDGVVLNFSALCLVDDFALLSENFARDVAYDVFCEGVARNTRCKREFLVVFIAADLCQVVTLVIVERVVNEDVRTFDRGNFARTQTTEQIDFALFLALALSVFFASLYDHLVPAEQVDDLLVRAVAECSQKRSRGDFSRSVDVHPLHFVGILFVFQPRASVGDDGRRITRYAVLVKHLVVVNAGASDKL